MIPFGYIVCKECSGDLFREGMYARCKNCGSYFVIVFNPDGSFRAMNKVKGKK